LIIYYVVALIVVVIDQVTKYMIVKTMELSETIPLIEGVFHITSHRNRGAAFGILQDARWFFIVITVIVVAAIVWYMPRIRGQKVSLWGFTLILGGAVGNFIDRLLKGEVVDFLDFRLIHFPIFNVADSCIVIGVGLLLLDTLREAKQAKSVERLKVEVEDEP
jgi:signal peptidase II